MNAKTLTEFILEFQEKDAGNKLSAEFAKKPEYAGRKIYEGALLGIAAADDEIIKSLRSNNEANIDLKQPEEWLPGAKTVLSFFMPFAKWITEDNEGGGWPSEAWLNGRIEGQVAINEMILALADRIKEEGYETVIPSLDPRFKAYKNICSSNWSERHVAFAAGLGTFGLSRGIITELGMAGRLTSLVTTLCLEPTPRPYKDLMEYCVKCGACIRNCPVEAISFEHLKDNKICDVFIDDTRRKEEPYYGCGKCQCGVPCAFGIPKK